MQKEHESDLVDGFRGIDRAVGSFALAAILDSVAFLEALVNSVWQDAADVEPESTTPNTRLDGLSDANIARMRGLWNTDRVERSLTVLEKYQVALTCADQ
jgi:hypothetical protein